MANWCSALIRDMKLPSNHVIRTDVAVVMRDKFPKARHHFLVLPWEDIDTIYQLTTKHIPLLEEIGLLGLNAIEICRGKREDFKMGFHMNPSMRRLHLHVVSKDFVSDCLKRMEHWNSFNTEYFMPFEAILAEITETGTIERRSEEYMTRLIKSPLTCNQCKFQSKTIPDLKYHLESHTA